MSKTYIVTIALKFAPYGQQASEIEVYAKNKAAAISEARKQVSRECWFSRQDGPVSYSAVEA